MKRSLVCALAAAAAFALSTSTASAVDLAVWTFQTSVPATSGPHSAEGGVNAGAGSPASGSHAVGATVYDNPSGNGSTESYSSNNWTTGDYYQFRTSTTGYNNICIAWSQTRSNTGPSVFDLEWSLTGVGAFTLLSNDYVVLANTAGNGGAWSSGSHINNYDFACVAAPAALNNQANVYFRMTSTQTTAAAGTNRVDDVVIRGDQIPEPATMGLLALGLLAIRRRK